MLTVETPEGVYLNVRSQHEHASNSAVCMSLARYTEVKLARDDEPGILVLALQGHRGRSGRGGRMAIVCLPTWEQTSRGDSEKPVK
jgi:hypothetical protein